MTIHKLARNTSLFQQKAAKNSTLQFNVEGKTTVFAMATNDWNIGTGTPADAEKPKGNGGDFGNKNEQKEITLRKPGLRGDGWGGKTDAVVNFPVTKEFALPDFNLQPVFTMNNGSISANQNPKIKVQRPGSWTFPGVKLPNQENWGKGYGIPPHLNVPSNVVPENASGENDAPATHISFANYALGASLVLGASALALKFGSKFGAAKVMAKLLPEAEAALPQAERSLENLGLGARLARTWDEIKTGAQVMFGSNKMGGLKPSLAQAAPVFGKALPESRTAHLLFNHATHFTSSGKKPLIEQLETQIDVTSHTARADIIARSAKIIGYLKNMVPNIKDAETASKVKNLIGKFESNLKSVEDLRGSVRHRLDAPGDLRRLHAWTEDYIYEAKQLLQTAKPSKATNPAKTQSLHKLKQSFDEIFAQSKTLTDDKKRLTKKEFDSAGNAIHQKFIALQRYALEQPLSDAERKVLQNYIEQIAYEGAGHFGYESGSTASCLSKESILDASRGKTSISGRRNKGIKRVK